MTVILHWVFPRRKPPENLKFSLFDGVYIYLSGNHGYMTDRSMYTHNNTGTSTERYISDHPIDRLGKYWNANETYNSWSPGTYMNTIMLYMNTIMVT